MSTFLYILLFIVCLSILIMIHEAGHFAMAKLFKVYCFDFSIGFGPALLHKKRKNGETYFSLRAIPFGGYVSMYGEEAKEGQEFPDGVKDIPPERSLNNIKKWKRAIVLLAGIFMNAILALILYFIAACLPQQMLYLRYVEVESSSMAAEAGITSDDLIYYLPSYVEATGVDETNYTSYYVYDSETGALTVATSYDSNATYYQENEMYTIAENNGYYILDDYGYVTYADGSTEAIAAMISTSSDKLSFKNRSYDSILTYFALASEGEVNYNKEITANTADVVSVSFDLGVYKYDATLDGYYDAIFIPFTLSVTDEGEFESIGLSMALITTQNSFGEIMSDTFTNFGEGSIAIFKAIGGLFVGEGWSELGGVISIYQTTTTYLTNYNASFFLQVWALVSVNLAIFNLLPFPGLDGWQLLVLIVEAIAHREIPPKVKNIVSMVGVGLLLILMLLVLIKDVIGLF